MKKFGFATSAILYTVLLLFIVLLVSILNNLQNKRAILDALKEDTINALEKDTVTDAVLQQIAMINSKIGAIEEQLNRTNQKITDLESQIGSLQSGGVKGTEINETLSTQTSTSFGYIGPSVEIPANSYFCLTARAIYAYSKPTVVAICASSSECSANNLKSANSTLVGSTITTTYCGYTGTTSSTMYLWAKYEGATTNSLGLEGFYIPKA